MLVVLFLLTSFWLAKVNKPLLLFGEFLYFDKVKSWQKYYKT